MAYPIMIQGTMSGAGKSLFAAALCRIFRGGGLSAAPFKSQNMALNSFVTPDGLEIGRAQAMQAEAAGIEPSVLMNPILLKPTTDSGSQVIVNGEARANMSAAEYFKYKKTLVPEIMKAYNKLAGLYDVIVIEGAGSPVELNLRSGDIVNMGLAKMTKSPVLLIGDIDRGGVFAQLLGTLSLLGADERDLVKGLVVNKFRGDRELFKGGADILERRGKKPVIGVVPYVDFDIDDEDSLSERLNKSAYGDVNIAVIRLPKISNFTDFDVFSQYEGVSVRYIAREAELGDPDLIILPGTKNTISDMKWLTDSGLAARVRKFAASGTPVFGICGGYQMLGKKISDPGGAEGGGEARGLGLIDAKTVFSGEKTRCRVSGTVKCGGCFGGLSGARFEGYEIHMGRTYSNELPLTDSGGAWRGNVYGTYVHGFFDSNEVSEAIVKELFRRRGLIYRGGAPNRRAYREARYDLLAETVRENVNMDLIYKIIREGV